MKKGILVVLALFAVLFVSARGSAQVQTQSVGMTPATDTADYFIVVDHFKLPQSIFTDDPPPPVKFRFISDNFQSLFCGKTEVVKSAVLPKFHHDLRVAATDKEIITALGGEANPATMAGIYELLKLQPNGFCFV